MSIDTFINSCPTISYILILFLANKMVYYLLGHHSVSKNMYPKVHGLPLELLNQW
jgi:hypothetical protein